MKVLIAEDEPTFRQLLSMMLEYIGFEAVIAEDGNAAWNILHQKDSPQLALIDWMMPGVDGVELCRRVREQKREPYIYLILLTAKSESADIITAMEAGADDYLVKPPNPGELKARLNAGRRIIELQNQLVAARESVARHAADLESINNSLEGFSHVVTNNILLSLQSIASSAKFIQDLSCGRLDDQCKSRTKLIYERTRVLAEMINTLQTFLKPLRVPLERQRLDLSAMAREIAEELRKANPERRVSVLIGERIEADGDWDLLKAVLDKLMKNAWAHTRDNEEAVVEFGASETGGATTYFVRDNGMGFEKMYAEKLFLPFFRVPGTDSLAGQGIGLASINAIIRRHGGRIWAEGEPGKGATFYFTLPENGGSLERS